MPLETMWRLHTMTFFSIVQKIYLLFTSYHTYRINIKHLRLRVYTHALVLGDDRLGLINR